MPTIRRIRDPPVADLPITALRHFLLQLIYPIVHRAVDIKSPAFVFQKRNRPVPLRLLKNTEVQEMLGDRFLRRKLIDLHNPVHRAVRLLIQQIKILHLHGIIEAICIVRLCPGIQTGMIGVLRRFVFRKRPIPIGVKFLLRHGQRKLRQIPFLKRFIKNRNCHFRRGNLEQARILQCQPQLLRRFHLGGIKIVRLIGKADRSQAKHHRNARCRKGCPLWHTPEIRNPPDARFDIPRAVRHRGCPDAARTAAVRHIKQEHPVFPFFLTAQLFQCTLVAKSLAVVADDAAQPINKRIEPVQCLQKMQQEIHQYIMML